MISLIKVQKDFLIALQSDVAANIQEFCFTLRSELTRKRFTEGSYYFGLFKDEYNIKSCDLQTQNFTYSGSSFFGKLKTLELDIEKLIKENYLGPIHWCKGRLAMGLEDLVHRYESMLRDSAARTHLSLDKSNALILRGREIIAKFNSVTVTDENMQNARKEDFALLVALFESATTLKLSNFDITEDFANALLAVAQKAGGNNTVRTLSVVDVEAIGAAEAAIAALVKILPGKPKLKIVLNHNKVCIEGMLNQSKEEKHPTANSLEISGIEKTTAQIASLLAVLPANMPKKLTFANDAYAKDIALVDADIAELTISECTMKPTMVDDLCGSFASLIRLEELRFGNVAFSPVQKRLDFLTKILAVLTSQNLKRIRFGFKDMSASLPEEIGLLMTFLEKQPNIQMFRIYGVDWVQLRKDNVECGAFLKSTSESSEQNGPLTWIGVLEKHEHYYALHKKFVNLKKNEFPSDLDEKQWSSKINSVFKDVCFEAIELMGQGSDNNTITKQCNKVIELIGYADDADKPGILKKYIAALNVTLIPELTANALAIAQREKLTELYVPCWKACLQAVAKHQKLLLEPSKCRDKIVAAKKWMNEVEKAVQDQCARKIVADCAAALIDIQVHYMNLLKNVLCGAPSESYAKEIFKAISVAIVEIKSLVKKYEIQHSVDSVFIKRVADRYDQILVHYYKSKIVEDIVAAYLAADALGFPSQHAAYAHRIRNLDQDFLGTRLSKLMLSMDNNSIQLKNLHDCLVICWKELNKTSPVKETLRAGLREKFSVISKNIEDELLEMHDKLVSAKINEDDNEFIEIDYLASERKALPEEKQGSFQDQKSTANAQSKSNATTTAVKVMTQPNSPSSFPAPPPHKPRTAEEKSPGCELLPLEPASLVSNQTNKP